MYLASSDRYFYTCSACVSDILLSHREKNLDISAIRRIIIIQIAV